MSSVSHKHVGDRLSRTPLFDRVSASHPLLAAFLGNLPEIEQVALGLAVPLVREPETVRIVDVPAIEAALTEPPWAPLLREKLGDQDHGFVAFVLAHWDEAPAEVQGLLQALVASTAESVAVVSDSSSPTAVTPARTARKAKAPRVKRSRFQWEVSEHVEKALWATLAKYPRITWLLEQKVSHLDDAEARDLAAIPGREMALLETMLTERDTACQYIGAITAKDLVPATYHGARSIKRLLFNWEGH